MAFGEVDWQRLGRAVVARRVELGFHTQVAFAEHIGLTARILGDIEGGKRLSYGKSTIARIGQGLKWEPGTADAILARSTLGLRDARPSADTPPPGLPIPDPVADLLTEYRQAAGPDRDAMLEQVRRITEWARYRRER